MKTIEVTYIPEVWEAIWVFPTPYNTIFDKTQTLFWTEVTNG